LSVFEPTRIDARARLLMRALALLLDERPHKLLELIC